MSVVRPFSVLSRDELGLSKTGRFLSKAEILGVGVFSPFQIECFGGGGQRGGAILLQFRGSPELLFLQQNEPVLP